MACKGSLAGNLLTEGVISTRVRGDRADKPENGSRMVPHARI